MFIAPGLETTMTAFCTADCTANTLPEGGVTVFGSLLHSHLRGVSMSLRHVRDGVELEPIDVNEHYDFNYQQVIFHDESRELLPGDQLILHCSYDTTGDDNMIFGGEGTSFVYYAFPLIFLAYFLYILYPQCPPLIR